MTCSLLGSYFESAWKLNKMVHIIQVYNINRCIANKKSTVGFPKQAEFLTLLNLLVVHSLTFNTATIQGYQNQIART